MIINSIKYELEKPEGIIQPDVEVDTEINTAYKVILYNDDHHTFDEVITQLIKAVNCSY